jgi:trans-aconitate methyltransferase
MLTPEYQEQLKNLHNSSKAFGNKAVIPEDIALLIEKYQVGSILDFGCGKGHMVLALKEKYPNIIVYGFDPGMESFDDLPKNVDMIFSFDVLEHIEPELLDQTLVDLAQRTNKVMYHLIACHPAKKSLSDGRNAHLIVETPEWWKQKLQTVLNWKMYNDNTIVYTSTKGNPSTPQGVSFEVIKYLVTLEKV